MPKPQHAAHKGSVLILTLMMIVLMTFEVALVSLVVLHGLGEEGVLGSQNISAKRAANAAINQLSRQLATELQSKPVATVTTNYALGGSSQGAYNNQILQVTDPATGATANSDPLVYTSAWVDTTDTRGKYFHLVGRARVGTIDLLVHRWEWLDNCYAGPMLTTIVANEAYPGFESAVAALPDGRVVFGQNKAGGSLWTWQKDTGLTTITTGDYWGARSILTADKDRNRFYIAEGKSSGRFAMWSESAGLSIIVTAAMGSDFSNLEPTNNDYYSIDIDSDGRAYFGTKDPSGNFYTYSDSTGLSVILSGASHPGRAKVHASNGRVFFGETYGAKRMMTWSPSTNLSIINSGWGFNGNTASVSTTDGRLFWSAQSFDKTPTPFWTWKNGVLSTLVVDVMPGYRSTKIAPNGRVYWGTFDTYGGTEQHPFWTWKEGTGLSTLVDAVKRGGDLSTVVSPTGRVFFGNSSGILYTWAEGQSQASIITTGGGNIGMNTAIAVDENDRVFYGNTTTYNLYTWHLSTGISALLPSNVSDAGNDSVTVTPTGRVYFSNHVGTNTSVWTWQESTGLSVIASGLIKPAHHSRALLDDGTFFFGQNADPGNFYAWSPGENCSTR